MCENFFSLNLAIEKKFPNTHQQRHLWSEHGTQSTKHGSYTEQGHAQFGGEHLCGEHVHGIK